MVSFLEATKPGGVYSRFHVTGMMEGFFGFESFDSGIFLRRENVASTFLGGLI